MIRSLLILFVFAFSACSGTLEFDDGTSLQDGASQLTAGAADAAPTAAPATPTTETTTPTTQTPVTEPVAEEPMPEEPVAEEPAPTEPEEPALPELGSIVDFEIAQGTGTSAWNTEADPVVVYVGQVLRITNFDDRDHRMHASDDAAFPHGDTIRPGQSVEYVVASAMPLDGTERLWDHNDGRSAAFWVEALEFPNP